MADTAALAPMPAWWAETQFHLFETPQPNGHRIGLDRAVIERGVPQGERDVSIFKLACSLRGHDIEYGEALKVVLAAAAKCSPPFPIAEAELKLKQAWRYPAGKRLRVVFGEAPDYVLPLPDDQVLPFPLYVLPGPIRDLVTAGATSISCQPDFIAVPALVALGAAIGTSRALIVKPGWEILAVMFAAVVGDPGSRKSPGLSLAIAPIKDQQGKAAQAFVEAEEAFESTQRQFDLEWTIYSQELKDHTKRPNATRKPEPPMKPQPPSEESYYTTNTTIEALASMLSGSRRGVAVFHDELTAWARSMNMYRAGKGDDRQQWLKFWTAEAIRVTRKGTKSIFLPMPFVSVAGCLPPEVLNELRDDQGREDGFVHRLLFCFPDPIQSQFTRKGIPPEIIQRYRQVFLDIWAKLQSSRTAEGHEEPYRVTFTPDGLEWFEEWVSEHSAETANDTLPSALRGPWAKLESYCLRLALVLQETRFICGEADTEHVDGDSVCAAADLVDYFKSHARRVYKLLTTSKEDKQAVAVAKWIKQHGGRTTNRDLLRQGVGGVQKASEVKAILKDLEDRQLGFRENLGRAAGFTLGVKPANEDENDESVG